MRSSFRFPVLIILLTIVLSTVVLGWLLGHYGVFVSRVDSFRYLRTAFNVANGIGLFIDERATRPLTQHAPLLSLVYGGVMALGVPFAMTQVVVAVVSWIVFLGGSALLTYRLSASLVLAAFATAVAALTYIFLFFFQALMSEVIYLPLLVITMAFLVDLPRKEQNRFGWLGLVSVLLGLLMVARYAGVFVVGTVILWWCWWRIEQRELRRLLPELAIFALTGVPLAAWLVRNYLLVGSDEVVGLQSSSNIQPVLVELQQGLQGVMYEHLQIILPAVRPSEVWAMFGWFSPFLYLLPVVGALYLAGQRGKVHWSFRLAPPRSPIMPFLVLFVALYIFVQPFFRFTPMDARDATVILCLIHPWLIAWLGQVQPGRTYVFLGGYVGLNLLLLLVVAAYGSLAWLSPGARSNLQGFLSVQSFENIWVRSNVIAANDRDLDAYLRQLVSNTLIFGNDRRLNLHYNRPYEPVDDWLERPRCVVGTPTSVVLFFWQEQEISELRGQVEGACPGLAKRQFAHALVYTPFQPTADPAAALASNPNDDAAYLSRGLRLAGQEQWPQALADFERTVALSPTWLLPYFARGEALTRMNDPVAAMRNYAQVLDIDPTNAHAYFELGKLQHQRGRERRALQHFNRAIALSSLGNPRFHLARGRLLAERRPELALQDYQVASQLVRADPLALLERGNLHARLKQWPEAIADYTRALRRTRPRRRFTLYVQRAHAYTQSRQWTRAIADYSEALTLRPDRVEVYLARGEAYVQAGQIEQARQDLQRVVEQTDNRRLQRRAARSLKRIAQQPANQ